MFLPLRSSITHGSVFCNNSRTEYCIHGHTMVTWSSTVYPVSIRTLTWRACSSAELLKIQISEFLKNNIKPVFYFNKTFSFHLIAQFAKSNASSLAYFCLFLSFCLLLWPNLVNSELRAIFWKPGLYFVSVLNEHKFPNVIVSLSNVQWNFHDISYL